MRYQCKICLKKFIQIGTLKRHCDTHGIPAKNVDDIIIRLNPTNVMVSFSLETPLTLFSRFQSRSKKNLPSRQISPQNQCRHLGVRLRTRLSPFPPIWVPAILCQTWIQRISIFRQQTRSTTTLHRCYKCRAWWVRLSVWTILSLLWGQTRVTVSSRTPSPSIRRCFSRTNNITILSTLLQNNRLCNFTKA